MRFKSQSKGAVRAAPKQDPDPAVEQDVIFLEPYAVLQAYKPEPLECDDDTEKYWLHWLVFVIYIWLIMWMLGGIFLPDTVPDQRNATADRASN